MSKLHKVVEIKFGSHLYGTNTENSDLDFKGIYLPSEHEILLHSFKKTIQTTRPKQTGERNTKDDVDLEIISLCRFFELLLEGQTMALDMLFAPQEMYTFSTEMGRQIMKDIYENRMEFLNKNVNAFVGYAKQQAAKYGQKGFRVHALRVTLEWLNSLEDHTLLSDNRIETTFMKNHGNEHIKITYCKAPNGKVEPHLEVCDKKYPYHATVKYVKAQLQRKFDAYGARALKAEKNEGVDWKALSHAVRVNSEALELLRTGVITFPRPDKDLLLKIKTGQMSYKEVAEIIEKGLEELKEAPKKSILRDKPNKWLADNYVKWVYKKIITEHVV